MHPSLPFLSLSRFPRLIHGEKLNGFADRSLWWRFERSSKAFPSNFRSNSISYWIDRSIGEERNVLTRRLPPIRNEFYACTSSVLRVSCRPNFAGATSRNAGNDGRELQAELVERTVITRVRERGEGGGGVDSKSPRLENGRGKGDRVFRGTRHRSRWTGYTADVMSAIINWLSSRRWRESWKRGRGNNGSTGTFIREVWFGA